MEEQFKDVVWIGGPSGSGKSTIGRRLAIMYGLRYVGVDRLMQEHHRRGVERRLPGMSRWEQLTADERWLGDPEAMAALLMEIGDETFSLLMEDVRTLSRNAGLLVEGRPLRPSLVVPLSNRKRNAVWILPTAEAQERNLHARGASARSLASDPELARRNRLRREQLAAEQLAKEAVELGCQTVRAGVGDDLDAVYRAVEAALRPALVTVKHAAHVDERFALRREENEDLAQHLWAFLVERPDAGTPDTIKPAFACECGRPEDFEVVELSLNEFKKIVDAGRAVLAPAHRSR
jgi:hypothetical protein